MGEDLYYKLFSLIFIRGLIQCPDMISLGVQAIGV